MGVRNLMKYISSTIPTNETIAITTVKFSHLYGKTISVDSSIYLYKFKQDGCLIESLFRMISTFQHSGIVPVFVFDGKPPTEKDVTIECRRQRRNDSRSEYDELVDERDRMIARMESSECHRQTSKINRLIRSINISIERKRRESVRITRQDISDSKELMDAMGVLYIHPDYEADPMCVKLVNSRIAYACLSEDTDMFVYGCTRILRSMDLYNMTFTLYDTVAMLQQLKSSREGFRLVCYLAGTDYTVNPYTHDICDIGATFKKYRQCHTDTQFREYAVEMLCEQGVSYDDMNELYDYHNCDISNYRSMANSLRYDIRKVREITGSHGFIYDRSIE